jgi:CheY-like chemotaxis protein
VKTANQLLLVEDNAGDFGLMKRALSKYDLQDSLVWMQSGEDAIRFLSNGESVALIVSDLKMPKMDGLEFYAWIKSNPALSGIPFILLTSSNQQPDRQRAMLLGITHYYVKPAIFSELIEIAESFRKYL